MNIRNTQDSVAQTLRCYIAERQGVPVSQVGQMLDDGHVDLDLVALVARIPGGLDGTVYIDAETGNVV